MALSKRFAGKRYGEVFEGKRAPFNNLQGELEGPLVSLLRREVMSQLAKTVGENKLRNADMAHVADWHAVASHSCKAMQIFVPRPAGGYKSTPSLPPALMAFAVAFRSKNADVFHTMVKRLRQLDSDEARAIAKTIDEDRHLGMWEVQHFYGKHKREGGWHIDGATSLLHLSVTLGGQRNLTVEYAEQSDRRCRTKKETKTMSKGDVYLSSPYLFHHGVEFMESSRLEDGSLSIQMRMGYTNILLSKPSFNLGRSGAMLKVAEVIAGVLEETPVHVPNLAEVEFWREQLQPTSAATKRKQPDEPTVDDRPVARPRTETHRTVSLKGCHDKYILAHLVDGKLEAKSSMKREWEAFRMERNQNGTMSFKSYHDKYITAHPDGKIRATASKIQGWEEFHMEANHNGSVSFKTHHGKYITAHANHKVDAAARNKQAWEEFVVERH